MQRCALLVIVSLAACAKGADKAPAGTATGAPPGDPAATADKPSRQQALDEARTQASLGPSAETNAFEPLQGDNGEQAKAEGKGGRDAKDKREETSAKQATSVTAVTPDTVAVEGGGAPAPDGAIVRGAVPPRAPAPEPLAIVVTTADGTPAPSGLDTAVRAANPALRACYDDAARTSAVPAGTLRLTFTVQPSGALTAAKIAASTLGLSAIDRCVIGIVNAIKLGKPLGTTEVAASALLTWKP